MLRICEYNFKMSAFSKVPNNNQNKLHNNMTYRSFYNKDIILYHTKDNSHQLSSICKYAGL